MSMLGLVLAIGVSLGAARDTHHAAVSPIQKVLQMMADMKSKALKDKQNEIVGMAKFTTFCENTEKSKTTAIGEGKEQAEQLSADIQKLTSDAKVLAEEIAKLEGSIALAEEDKASAIDLRKTEKADYSKTHAEMVESIADLQAALGRIKQMMAASPGASAASLLQELAAKPMMAEHAKRMLTAFISENSGADMAIA